MEPSSDSRAAVMEALAGMSEYDVIKPLGRGGMGFVFLVRHRLTQRLEVLKLLRPNISARPQLRERFLREVRSAAKLDHPNVVKTLTAIERGSALGMVMEYVDGEDLDKLIKRRGPLPEYEATQIISGAAAGLQHAADNGLVHRDVKPSNLIVTERDGSYHAKLLDFGLSKIDEDEPNDGLTVAGRILGTPEYMAPEQALDPGSATTASDIYGLGCSLYYALSGRPPYAGATALAVLTNHLHAPVPDIRTVRPDVSLQTAAALARMLNKEPRNRFRSPAEIIQALSGSAIAVSEATHAAGEAVSFDEPQPAPIVSTRREERPPLQRPPARHSAQPVLRTARSRAGKKSSPLSYLPHLFISAATIGLLAYFRPWDKLLTESPTVLVLTDVSADINIEVDGRVLSPAVGRGPTPIEFPITPGTHKLRFTRDGLVLGERPLELKPGMRMEIAANFPAGAPALYALNTNTKSPDQTANSGRDVNRDRSQSGPGREQSVSDDSRDPQSEDSTMRTADASNKSPGPDKTAMNEEPSKDVPANAFDDPNVLTKSIAVEKDKLIADIVFDRALAGLTQAASSMVFVPKGATGNNFEQLVVLQPEPRSWDTKSGASAPFRPVFQQVKQMSFGRNNRLCLFAGDHYAEAWSLPRPAIWFRAPNEPSVKHVYRLTTDGRFMASVDFNESLMKWNMQSKDQGVILAAKQPKSKEKLIGLALTPKLDAVITLDKDGSLTAWETSKGERIVEIAPRKPAKDNYSSPAELHIADDATTAAIVWSRGEIEIRKLNDLELIGVYGGSSALISAVAVGGPLLAVCDFNNDVTVFDTEQQQFIAHGTLDNSSSVTGMALASDGKSLAVAHADTTVSLLKIRKKADGT